MDHELQRLDERDRQRIWSEARQQLMANRPAFSVVLAIAAITLPIAITVVVIYLSEQPFTESLQARLELLAVLAISVLASLVLVKWIRDRAIRREADRIIAEARVSSAET